MSGLLWLDDRKQAPRGWEWVKSVNEAIAMVNRERVCFMSLDNDLGRFAHDGGDGLLLTDWMAAHDTWPTAGIRIHSGNSVAVPIMLATIDRYGPFAPTGWGITRGADPSGGWPPAVMAQT